MFYLAGARKTDATSDTKDEEKEGIVEGTLEKERRLGGRELACGGGWRPEQTSRSSLP